MNAKTLLQVVLLFSSLSLLSIGGGNTVLPEMHHKVVGDYDWLTDSQFADVSPYRRRRRGRAFSSSR